mmetsp:Transcript_1977/g.6547  ORF Transcript_1977/g.6547 Transcript_1977/m.6547 type:complete len:229 (-) Transcript_1977:67-753(-)
MEGARTREPEAPGASPSRRAARTAVNIARVRKAAACDAALAGEAQHFRLVRAFTLHPAIYLPQRRGRRRRCEGRSKCDLALGHVVVPGDLHRDQLLRVAPAVPEADGLLPMLWVEAPPEPREVVLWEVAAHGHDLRVQSEGSGVVLVGYGLVELLRQIVQALLRVQGPERGQAIAERDRSLKVLARDSPVQVLLEEGHLLAQLDQRCRRVGQAHGRAHAHPRLRQCHG